MTLRVVGAGLPRTGTASLTIALKHLLGGEVHHMSVIPGHPFDLGAGWDLALAGGTPEWDDIFTGYVAAVDWPSSMFWRPLSEAYPEALILLSVRDSAETWLQSAEATFLPYARMAQATDWSHGRSLLTLLEQYTGSKVWDEAGKLMAAYERHNAAVRGAVVPQRLLEWQAQDGWEPICMVLGLPMPEMPFPWMNRREEWG